MDESGERLRQLEGVGRARQARERAALGHLAEAEAGLARQSGQLDELRAYLRDYEQLGVVANVRWLANRAQFLDRLRGACETQNRQVALAREGVETARRHYLIACRDVEALDQLRDGYRDEARRQDERREQQAVDDGVAARRSLQGVGAW